MRKFATLLLLCMALSMFIPSAVLAEEKKEIPADTEVIFVYEESIGDIFEIIETEEPVSKQLREVGRQTYGESYLNRAPMLFGANHAVRGDGVVSLGPEYMGYLLVYYIDGPSVGQFSGLYDEENKVFYYFPEHAFSLSGSEIRLGKYKTEIYSIVEANTYSITMMTAKLKKFPYITVTYNGEMINFDQKPVAENGRTLVPLRAIFNKLGATVDWNQATQTVTATKGEVVITLTLNNTTATKNGQPITLDVPAKALGGRILVPVRFIADCFNVTTGWDGNLQRVILTD